MGKAHLDKAKCFYQENNWLQVLHYSDLAATKLMQLKDRPIEEISDALSHKFDSLGYLGRYSEQLECAKEWYCLWNTKPTDPGALDAIFALIGSFLTNKQYDDAILRASTLLGIINHKNDNKIPEDQRQMYLAEGSYYLAVATLALSKASAEGIPPEVKQTTGQKVIALAREALKIHTQLDGTESNNVAKDMVVLADTLAYLNNDDDDEEVLRLYKQSKTIYALVFGSSSLNVAVSEEKLGNMYHDRAVRATDLDQIAANLELKLSHLRESARIYRAVGRMEKADCVDQRVVALEEQLRHPSVAAAVAAATAAAAECGV